MTFNNAINVPKLTADGQLLIGNASGNPIAANLSAGSNISITNSSGGIQISAANLSVNSIIYTANGTYTPSAGTVAIYVECLGSGGGGGYCPNSGPTDVIVAGGGGGGVFVSVWTTPASIGASIAVAVGPGGPGGGGTGQGSTGGDCGIPPLVYATGGGGGFDGVLNVDFSAGGDAGGYNGSLPNLLGSLGQIGGYAGISSATGIPAYTYAGYGGGAYFSGDTGVSTWSPQVGSVSYTGFSGTSFGQGGGGAYTALSGVAANGGDGVIGFVRITEYILS